MDEFLTERYELAVQRIREIEKEELLKGAMVEYFGSVARFLMDIDAYYEFVKSGEIGRASLGELQEWNLRLYGDILPESYENSFANPAYAVAKLGEEYGPYFAVLVAEMRSAIVLAAAQKLEQLLIRMELFV